MNRYLSPDDPDAAVASLRKAYADTPIWFGHYTRHFWALVGNKFLEAAHPSDLANLLDNQRPQAPKTGRTVRVPPGGKYGPPMMAAAARSTPSPSPARERSSHAAAPSLAVLRPRRHRIGSRLPAAAW